MQRFSFFFLQDLNDAHKTCFRRQPIFFFARRRRLVVLSLLSVAKKKTVVLATPFPFTTNESQRPTPSHMNQSLHQRHFDPLNLITHLSVLTDCECGGELSPATTQTSHRNQSLRLATFTCHHQRRQRCRTPCSLGRLCRFCSGRGD